MTRELRQTAASVGLLARILWFPITAFGVLLLLVTVGEQGIAWSIAKIWMVLSTAITACSLLFAPWSRRPARRGPKVAR